MSRKAGLFLTLGCTLALLLAASVPAYAQSSPSHTSISQKIDETARVTLAGNTRPEARAARDLGPVSDDLQMSHMYLQMKMSSQSGKGPRCTGHPPARPIRRRIPQVALPRPN